MTFVPKGPIGNNLVFKKMSWRRIGVYPLSEPMLTQFSDAYMRQNRVKATKAPWLAKCIDISHAYQNAFAVFTYNDTFTWSHYTACLYSVVYLFWSFWTQYLATFVCHARFSLQRSHNGGDDVSYNWPDDCSLNCLFRRRSKKTSKHYSDRWILLING